VQRELDVLVADLPAAEPAPAPPPAPTDGRAAPAARPPFHERIGKAVVPIVMAAAAVFVGGHLVTADDGAAVFGNRTVTVSPGDPQVEVGTLFGRTRVVVLPGSVARTTGTMIFGSTRCDLACQPPPGGATLPEVVVDANGAFGSVEVVTPAEAAQGGLRGRDDDEDD
jgi:hypothetical protein